MKKILILDDEPMILHAMEDLFEDDFEVITTTDPGEALAIVAREELAVVLSDQRMPRLNGHDFLARIRETSQAVRILITGYTDMEALALAVNSGHIFAYVNKPWDPMDLRLTVRRAVESYDLQCEIDYERNLLQALMESVPDPVYLKDTQSRFIRINRGWARFAGTESPDNCIGKTDFDFFEPEFAAQAYEDEQKLFSGEEASVERIEQVVRSDGSTAWFLSSKVPVRDKRGRITGLAGISKDVSPLKEVEAALRASEQQFRQIAENIENVVWLSQPPGNRLLYINPAYERIWGRSCESIYVDGTSWMEAIHPDDRESMDQTMEKLAEGVIFDYRILRPDGEVRSIVARTFPVRNDAGEVYRVAGIAEDVTERRAFEESLQHAQKQADQANRAKGEFLATMSHEMRTPLNSVLGMSDLLWDTPLTPDQRTYLTIVRRAGAKLLNLIDDILDLSKIEFGRLELEARQFEPVIELDRMLELVRAQAQEKRLQLTLNIDPTVPKFVIGDPHRLQQILLNLAANAIKFTEAGKIVVSMQRDPAAGEGDGFRFSVSDTGIGIPADKIQVIFEDFTQADSSTTRRYGGSGLGLSICKRLVELMGGKISLESRVGHGSTFSFTVKFGSVVETSGSRSPIQSSVADRRARRRILVAEDCDDNLFLIRAYLKNSGIEIEEATNGRIAVDKFKTARYDTVLMDVQMPVLDGYSATREIREWESSTEATPTPILALTANALKSDPQKSAEAGCTAHLSKPISRATLLKALETYCPARCVTQ